MMRSRKEDAKPAVAEKKQAKGGKWKRGRGGNPSGKKPGVRPRASVFAERLIGGQTEALLQKTIKMAIDGDARIIKALLDRHCSAPKSRPVNLPLRTAEAAQLSPDTSA